MSAVLSFYADGGELVLDALLDQLAGGSAKLYDGATLLVTIPLNTPAGSVSGVTLTFTATASATVGTAGDADTVVYCDAGGDPVCEGAVTATGGGGAATIASVTLEVDGTASLTGGTIALPLAS